MYKSLNYKINRFFCFTALCNYRLKSSPFSIGIAFMFTISTPSHAFSRTFNVPYLFYELQSYSFSLMANPARILTSNFLNFCLMAENSLSTKWQARGNYRLSPSNNFSLPEKDAPIYKTVKFMPLSSPSSELSSVRSLI